MAKESSSIIPILVIGGIGYYLYSSGFFSSLFGGASQAVASGAIPPPVTPTNPNPAATTTTPPTPPPSLPTGPKMGDVSVTNGATYTYDGSKWVLTTPAPTPPSCPSGVTLMNGVCNIGGAVENMGGSSSLHSFDEWCYYFTQITGLPCPVDPGTISPQQWNDAGVVVPGADGTAASSDGTIGNRSTPITFGTWVAFIKLLAPGTAGISGIRGLGNRNKMGSFDLSGLGCECDYKTDPLFKGLGQILDFNDFFALQPHRKHLTGNFK